MTRTIHPTLLATARSFQGKPTLHAAIADTRLHWSILHDTAGASELAAQVADDTTIHRIRTNATDAQVARVTDPTTASQWTTWTKIGTIVAGSDVSIARYAANSLRAFYLSSAGGPNIRERQSTDSGATWGAPTAAVTPAAGSYHFAAAGQKLFYLDGVTITHLTKASGTWAGSITWAAFPTITTCHGIAVAYNGTSTFALLVAHDGYLSFGTYINGIGFSAATQLYPGPNGVPATNAIPKYPSIAIVGSQYLITYLDTYAGSPARAQPTVALTDGTTITNQTAVHLAATTARRTAATYITSTRRIYLANESAVTTALAYDASDTTQNITSTNVLAYTRDTRPHRSTITAQLFDPTGALKTFGQESTAAAALRPLAKFTLSRGYILSGTPTRIALDPHYITRITYNAHANPGICTIQAEDGWTLLELWQPDTLLTFTNHTVAQLIDHILARVGLVATDDGSAGASYTVPTFTITPATNGREAALQALALGGLQGIWQEDGSLYAVQLAAYAPGAIAVGSAEILSAAYSAELPPANDIRYYGMDATPAQVGGSSTDDTAAQQLGLSRTISRFDARLTTNAEAAIAAALLAEQEYCRTYRDEITLPLRPDVEIYDKISLDTDTTIIPTAIRVRRVTRIREEHSAKHGTFRCTLETTRA